MGGYPLTLQGSVGPSDGGDGSSRWSSNAGNGALRGGDLSQDSPKGDEQHSVFPLKRAQKLLSPPRHSTACCDGLSERREVERRLSSQWASTIVPLQDFHYMGQSFRSEESESLALWEEKEQPASNEHGWIKLARNSPRWLDAMRKFDTAKLAPWRSSAVLPKTSLEGQRLSLSDRKGSMKSLDEAFKSPWFTNATKMIRNGESRLVRSSLGVSRLLPQSGELIPSSGELLIPRGRNGELSRSDDSRYGNSSTRRDAHLLTEEDKSRLQSSSSVARVISSKPELVVKKDCLVNGVTSGDGSNAVVQTERAHEDVTPGNATALEVETKTNSEYALRNPAVKVLKAVDASTCEADEIADETSAVHEKEEEGSALTSIKGDATVSFTTEEAPGVKSGLGEEKPATEATFCEAPHTSLHFAMPPSEQDDDASPYENLRLRYILKAESEPLGGNLYVIQPRTTSPAKSITQSAITNPKDEEELDVSSESGVLKLRSFHDAECHSIRVKTPSTPDRLFMSLRNKVFRSSSKPGPSPLGNKKNLGDILEAASPRSILCGLADEGSLPSSNLSLRSDAEMPAFSAHPAPASQSYSISGASFDLNDHDKEVARSGYSLNAPKGVESRRVSLSFRDFGSSRLSRENAASKVDAAAATKASSDTELLKCEGQLDDNEAGSSSEKILTAELSTATFPTNVQSPRAHPYSPGCVVTDREPAFSPCNTTPPRRLSYVSPSELEELHMSSVFSRSRPRHSDFTARLGGMFSPRRLISKAGEDGASSNPHNCFAAPSTLSPPHDDNLGGRSPAYDSTLELLSPSASHTLSKERKSKSKSQFSNRRRSSADSSDAPRMMISISKAMRKILSKCTLKPSSGKGKLSTMEYPVLSTLAPADFQFTEGK